MTNFLTLMTEIIGGLADLKTLLDSDNGLDLKVSIILLAIVLALIVFLAKMYRKRKPYTPVNPFGTTTTKTEEGNINININITQESKKK